MLLFAHYHYVSLKPIVDHIMATVWLLCRKKTLDFSFFSRFYLPTIAVLEEKKNAISGNMKHITNRKWLFGSTAISPEPISRCCLMYFGMLFVLKMTIKIFVFEFSIILPSITFFPCASHYSKNSEPVFFPVNILYPWILRAKRLHAVLRYPIISFRVSSHTRYILISSYDKFLIPRSISDTVLKLQVFSRKQSLHNPSK